MQEVHMQQQAGQIWSQVRKQLATFRSELTRKGILSKSSSMSTSREWTAAIFQRIAGLIPHGFPLVAVDGLAPS